MEQETQRIKELDDQFASDMNKWKAMLIPRKQVQLIICTRLSNMT